MDHQDWDPVYIGANKYINDKNNESDQKVKGELPKSVFSKENKIDKKIEEGNLKHEKTPIELGKLIQQKRLERNITQKDLAKKINVQVKIINEIECGKGKHNPQIISKIKRIFNISKI